MKRRIPPPGCTGDEPTTYSRSGPTLGLPALQGTPRQVAWAHEIRDKALRYLITTTALTLDPRGRDLVIRLAEDILAEQSAAAIIGRRGEYLAGSRDFWWPD